MTERLRQIVFCDWPCSGGPVQSEKAGPSASASREAGDEGGPRRGGGTAGAGGDGFGTSACGRASGSGAFFSFCSPSPFSASLHAAGSASAGPSAAVGSKPLEQNKERKITSKKPCYSVEKPETHSALLEALKWGLKRDVHIFTSFILFSRSSDIQF